MGCRFLLRGIFLPQGLNPRFLCLLYWQVDGFFTTLATWEAPQKLIQVGKMASMKYWQVGVQIQSYGTNTVVFMPGGSLTGPPGFSVHGIF